MGRRRVCIFALIVIISAAEVCDASMLIPDHFAVSRVTLADTQNSSILTVAVDPAGKVVGSNGFQITAVDFSTGAHSVTPGPLTDEYRVIQAMRFNPGGTLSLGMLDFQGPGRVLQVVNGAYPAFVTCAPGQSFLHSMAFDAAGNLVVSGTYGNINDPGWVRRYAPNGTLTAAADTAIAPVASVFDSGGKAYVASFDGGIYRLDASLPVLVAALDSNWVGYAIGYVTSLAIAPDDSFFVGVNLGQRFDRNSSAILRVRAGETELFAYGLDDIPQDMMFGPSGELLIANSNYLTGAHLLKITGDFAGAFQPPALPSPSGGAFALLCGLVLRRSRRA